MYLFAQHVFTCHRLRKLCCNSLQEEARADLRNAAAALEKERQAMSASTSDPGSVSTAAGIAAKPRNNNAVADSDSDVEIAAPAGEEPFDLIRINFFLC